MCFLTSLMAKNQDSAGSNPNQDPVPTRPETEPLPNSNTKIEWKGDEGVRVSPSHDIEGFSMNLTIIIIHLAIHARYHQRSPFESGCPGILDSELDSTRPRRHC
jgi:hypothetical protein